MLHGSLTNIVGKQRLRIALGVSVQRELNLINAVYRETLEIYPAKPIVSLFPLIFLNSHGLNSS